MFTIKLKAEHGALSPDKGDLDINRFGPNNVELTISQGTPITQTTIVVDRDDLLVALQALNSRDEIDRYPP